MGKQNLIWHFLRDYLIYSHPSYGLSASGRDKIISYWGNHAFLFLSSFAIFILYYTSLNLSSISYDQQYILMI
jgi:hypothetical protein